MTIDREAAARVRESKQFLFSRSSRLVAEFYELLFQSLPQIRAMFPSELDEHHRKLSEAIGLVADNSEDLSKIAESLRLLGKRHVLYGAQPHHYIVVQRCLISAMRSVAAEKWSATLEADWQAVLDRVVKYMLEQSHYVAHP